MTEAEQQLDGRLNYPIERRLDSLALVVMIANEHGARVPEVIGETLDHLGIVALSALRRQLGVGATEMQAMIVEFSDRLIKAGGAHRTWDGVMPHAKLPQG